MTFGKLSFRGLKRLVRGDESGQALVELALSFVMILVPILIGSAEFARAAYAYIEVSNAARAAVAYGAQTHATALDTTGMLTAARNDYAFDPTKLTLLTSSYVCNCSDTGASASCSSGTACPGAHVELTLTVQTTANFDPGFYEPFLSRTFTVNGIAVQKVLQ
jgi:Flp pilus assembly protein TadG